MSRKRINRIALFALPGLIITVFFLSAIIYRYARKTAFFLYAEKQELISTSIANHFEDFLTWVTADLQQEVCKNCQRGMDKGKPDLKGIYQELVGKPGRLFFIDSEGVIDTVYPNEEKPIGICVKTDESFTRARDCLAPHISGLYRTDQNEWAFCIDVPVMVDNCFYGIVRAPFPVRDGVGGRITPPWEKTPNILWIVDQHGRVMFSADDGIIGHNLLNKIRKSGSDEEIKSFQSLMTGKQGSCVTEGSEGCREYVTYKPIRLAREQGEQYWGLAVSIPESEVFAGARWIFVGIGLLFLLTMAVTLLGSVVLFRQQSQAKEQVDKYNESLLWFSHALKAINEGVIITDLKGNIRFANEACCRILEKNHQELTNANIREIFACPPFQNIGEFIVNPSGDGDFTGEIWFRMESGEDRPLFITSSVISDENGDPYLLVVAFLNIRKLKEAEKELERRRLELESHLYTISHDLKSPLVSIRGYLDIFLKDCGDDLGAEELDLIGRVKSAAVKMTMLIEQIMELSKVGLVIDQSQKISVRRVLDVVVEYLVEEMRRKNIRFSAADDFPEIYADPERLAQVFDNLMSNAIKFMENETGESVIRVGWEEDENDYIFSVIDTGMGIDPEDQKKIFDPFYRLRHKDARGSGIGLAIVKRVIEQHGGRAWVESALGEGSTFFFSIPKIPPPRI